MGFGCFYWFVLFENEPILKFSSTKTMFFLNHFTEFLFFGFVVCLLHESFSDVAVFLFLLNSILNQ